RAIREGRKKRLGARELERGARIGPLKKELLVEADGRLGGRRRAAHRSSRRTCSTAERRGSISTGRLARGGGGSVSMWYRRRRPGSFRTCPVRTARTRSPGRIIPSRTSFFAPATLAALAASHPAPEPSMLGTREISPRSRASRRAFPNADVFPRLPAGSAIHSGGSQPSCSSASKTIVFCPSRRKGLTEFKR